MRPMIIHIFLSHSYIRKNHWFSSAFHKSAILHFTSFHVEQAINFDVGSLTLHEATGRASRSVALLSELLVRDKDLMEGTKMRCWCVFNLPRCILFIGKLVPAALSIAYSSIYIQFRIWLLQFIHIVNWNKNYI